MVCKRLSKTDRECPTVCSLAVHLQLSACALQQGYMLLQATKLSSSQYGSSTLVRTWTHQVRNEVVRLCQAEVAGQLVVADNGLAAAAHHAYPPFWQVLLPELPFSRWLAAVYEDTQVCIFLQP